MSVAPGLPRPVSTTGAALLLVLATISTGCGQKGPLTLPKSPASAVNPAASAPAR